MVRQEAARKLKEIKPYVSDDVKDALEWAVDALEHGRSSANGSETYVTRDPALLRKGRIMYIQFNKRLKDDRIVLDVPVELEDGTIATYEEAFITRKAAEQAADQIECIVPPSWAF